MTTLVPQYDQGATGAVNRPFNQKLAEQVSVLDFGAVGNGTTDDTAAIQAALNTGKNVYFPNGYTFGITSELTITTSNVTLFGGGVISFLATYNTVGNTLLSAITITGSNVIFNNINFNGSNITVASVTNRFIWFKAPKSKVSNCSFINLVGAGSNFNGAIQADANAAYLIVTSSYFENCPGAVFCQGSNCIMSNNNVLNPKDVCFTFNGPNAKYGVITGNSINNLNLNSAGALIDAEESASYWTISNNVINGVKNGIGIGALNVAVNTDVTGGVISGNVINGGFGTTSNPTTLIYVSAHYFNTLITDNLLSGLPIGSSGSAYITISATGGRVTNNIIDATAYTGVALMLVTVGSKGLTIENNTFTTVSASRHVLFNAGDYTGLPVTFSGGRFQGGVEGINTALNSPTNLGIFLQNITEYTGANFLNTPFLGDISAYFNTYNAITFPHSIKSHVSVYGNAAPTSIVKSNAVGDIVYNYNPVVGQPKAWVCTVAGAPGTWVSQGNL